MPGGKPSKSKQKETQAFVPKRGRPTQEQVAAIDAVILRVGREMFLDQGYAGTAIEAVATTAGVSKGTLYARYPTKTHLFKAIVSERLQVWESAWAVADLGGASLDEQMFRFGVAMLEAVRTPEIAAFDRLISNEATRFPEIAEAFQQQGYVRAITRLADLIRVSSAQTGRPVDDPMSVSSSFIYGLLGWYHVTSLTRELTLDDCARQVQRLLAIFTGGRATW